MRMVRPRLSGLSKSSCAVLLAACAVLLVSTGTFAQAERHAPAYAPARGPVFNRPAPVGTEEQQEAIQTKINAAIDHAPKGSTIRIATYGIDRLDSAKKLLRAHRRGVNVQIVVNTKRRPLATRMLKSGLHSHITHKSFIAFCYHGCRGRAANMHAKFYTFSRTGTAKDVVMIGSANLTQSQISLAWNDMYTLVDNRAIFKAYKDVFAEMKRDKRIKHPYRQLTVGKYTNYLFPKPGASMQEDPVYQALSDIRCRAAAGGAGKAGHTVVRVAMFSILQNRGLYLARKLVSLDDAGCDVRVIYGAPSHDVVHVLAASGVVVRDSRYDLNGNGTVDHYNHLKVLAINGAVKGDTSAWVTYTGSENWTSLALHRGDEDMIRINSRHVYYQYAAEYADIVHNGSYPAGKRLGLAPWTRFTPEEVY
jgi:phosphatidylserine/phosphatidylglycerophosphate/cardiolipin synthase-like enzyme